MKILFWTCPDTFHSTKKTIKKGLEINCTPHTTTFISRNRNYQQLLFFKMMNFFTTLLTYLPTTTYNTTTPCDMNAKNNTASTLLVVKNEIN